MYNTRIGEFCATHTNWEELLTAEPYNVLIKKEDGFVIFNYNQLSSDFSNEIVCEARGIIFREGEWEYPVCHAFDKFFNYGQDYCAELDWSSVTVSEKIDGSIMKLWCYNGCWHLSTNGMIDAWKATIGDARKDCFAQIFYEALRERLPATWANSVEALTSFYNRLNSECTYIFELVSPYTRVVIPYKTADIYFLGARDNKTNMQLGCDIDTAFALGVGMIPRPKLYRLASVNAVIAAASELPWDNEGYVCYDKNFNRCKIKSPNYVIAHFARNNNIITRKHLIDIILKGEIDEFIVYASDYADEIRYTKALMDAVIENFNTVGMLASPLRKLPRAQAASIIKKFDSFVQPVMFMNLAKNVSGKDYVADWTIYKWEKAIENYLKFIERIKQ